MSPSLKTIASFLLIVLTVYVLVSANTNATSRKWPAGKSPSEVGNKVADFVLSNYQVYDKPPILTDKPVLRHDYASVSAYYGVLIFADQTNNHKLLKGVTKAYEPYRVGKKTPTMGHVDNNLFGIKK